MHKVVIHKPGSYDRLKVEEHASAEPRSGQVRIAVEAIGVNYADVVVRMGLYRSAKEFVGWPITPGFEVAGRIDAIGPDVTCWNIGDEVFGVTLFGGYASQVVLHSSQVFTKPQRFSMIEAAAFPAAGLTAYHAMFNLAHPRAGETILVHSAAGGVGGALVQLGRIAGCQVIGVVGREEKVPVAERLGAHVVICKADQDLWREALRASPGGFEVVFDANGVATLKESYAHLAPTGRLVVYGFHSMMPKTGGRPNWLKLGWDVLRTPRFNPLQMTHENKSVMGFNLSYLFAKLELLHEGLTQLSRWVDDGSFVSPPVQTYALEDVAQAHADIESGRTVGKLVLIP